MASKERIFISVAPGIGKSVRLSLMRLARIYSIEIEHIPTGDEWVRVGKDLSGAMEESKKELPQQDDSQLNELVEA